MLRSFLHPTWSIEVFESCRFVEEKAAKISSNITRVLEKFAFSTQISLVVECKPRRVLFCYLRDRGLVLNCSFVLRLF